MEPDIDFEQLKEYQARLSTITGDTRGLPTLNSIFGALFGDNDRKHIPESFLQSILSDEHLPTQFQAGKLKVTKVFSQAEMSDKRGTSGGASGSPLLQTLYVHVLMADSKGNNYLIELQNIFSSDFGGKRALFDWAKNHSQRLGSDSDCVKRHYVVVISQKALMAVEDERYHQVFKICDVSNEGNRPAPPFDDLQIHNLILSKVPEGDHSPIGLWANFLKTGGVPEAAASSLASARKVYEEKANSVAVVIEIANELSILNGLMKTVDDLQEKTTLAKAALKRKRPGDPSAQAKSGGDGRCFQAAQS